MPSSQLNRGAPGPGCHQRIANHVVAAQSDRPAEAVASTVVVTMVTVVLGGMSAVRTPETSPSLWLSIRAPETVRRARWIADNVGTSEESGGDAGRARNRCHARGADRGADRQAGTAGTS
ncbi:hypothetical protein F4820DRAFT_453700 [Hypoxylon rubiginosum]|uniref:Uncharacterized protein n=1 Tax=Hypoxylon rubiginosum TaxID=110542 RepID=A0ACB9YKI5_9PEZI|nr:hypothetical protein F4820DRAFT_453700 [Hypoxylon rubiginosum]